MARGRERGQMCLPDEQLQLIVKSWTGGLLENLMHEMEIDKFVLLIKPSPTFKAVDPEKNTHTHTDTHRHRIKILIRKKA